MNIIGKNDYKNLQKLILNRNFKKIFFLTGHNSFYKSGANKIFKNITKNKEVNFFFKKKYLPELQELKKIIRVLGKNLDGSPHDRVIVLDGATGQNAHSQVTEFSKAVDISGMIVTKLDGSAKGGIVVSLAENFGIPIHSVGVGESLEDLDQFDAEEYSRAIVGLEKD